MKVKIRYMFTAIVGRAIQVAAGMGAFALMFLWAVLTQRGWFAAFAFIGMVLSILLLRIYWRQIESSEDYVEQQIAYHVEINHKLIDTIDNAMHPMTLKERRIVKEAREKIDAHS